MLRPDKSTGPTLGIGGYSFFTVGKHSEVVLTASRRTAAAWLRVGGPVAAGSPTAHKILQLIADKPGAIRGPKKKRR